MAIVKSITAPKSNDPREIRNWFESISSILSYQTYTGDPTSNIVPRWIGDRCFDTTNNKWYVAVGTTSADWIIQTLCPSLDSDHSTGGTITSSYGTLETRDLGTVVAGDIFLFSAYIIGTKGASNGNVWISLGQSAGTATLKINGYTTVYEFRYIYASGTVALTLTALGIVDVSGTATVRLQAQSVGSNTTGVGSTLNSVKLAKAI